MTKSGWSRLLFGVLVTAVVACSKPAVEEEREISLTDEPDKTELPFDPTEQSTTLESPTKLLPTHSPPPIPTAEPTTAFLTNWQQVGSEMSGLQIMAPPNWVNLSSQIDTPTAANELGLIVLLLADSEHTGSSLLSGKAIGDGAYVAGLISHRDLMPNSPQANLTQIINQMDKQLTLLDEPTPISAFTTSGGRVTGAYVDVVGDPLIFSDGNASSLRTRILFFTSTLAGAVNQDTQAIFLLSAPEAYWTQVKNIFTDMAKTVVIHNIYAEYALGEGAANVIGELAATDYVSGNLTGSAKDVWTFNIEEQRYATLTLSPGTASLDLTMTLISPSGQTVSQVDNGYAGDVETAADKLLLESGLYIIEIDEFFNEAGSYTLSLILTETPLFGGGGQMQIGQTIQSDLPDEGQQLWRFNADAGALISLVLTPGDTLDAILDVYAPDGRALISLDEGFSGDAEVVSGLELPLTGEYTILVHSFSGNSGSYTLALDQGGEETLNFYDAGDLAYNETRQEMLQPNEAHAWFFVGRAGDRIMAEVTPIDEQLDLDVWLLDPNVNRLTAVDKLLAGQPEYLAYTLPQDGQYLILVRDFFGEAGSYEINLVAMTAVPPDDAGDLTYGLPVQADLAPEQTVIWYFAAREGESINIRLEPTTTQADLRFVLVDPAGNPALTIDAADMGQPETSELFMITEDGRWGILVEEFFDEAAVYTLTVSQTP
ncbi:MAG: hypothetical protein GY796_18130 [Chloroflexi bacterium]|nr:hypothetical protein [Chloroflexota bacterium]